MGVYCVRVCPSVCTTCLWILYIHTFVYTSVPCLSVFLSFYVCVHPHVCVSVCGRPLRVRTYVGVPMSTHTGQSVCIVVGVVVSKPYTVVVCRGGSVRSLRKPYP